MEEIGDLWPYVQISYPQMNNNNTYFTEFCRFSKIKHKMMLKTGY